MALRFFMLLLTMGQLGLAAAYGQRSSDQQAALNLTPASAALLDAAVEGDAAKARSALDDGADVNARGKKGRTPLLVAEYSHSEMVVRVLLSRGADVNAHDAQGLTPLYLAALLGEPEVVALLLGKGVDLKPVTTSQSALGAAIQSGNLKTAELLLKRGADVNARDGNGQTPLNVAAVYGRVGMVKMLLEHGADVNGGKAGEPRRPAPGKYSFAQRMATPLESAIQGAHTDIAERLIEKGADVNATDEAGDTPLHYAVLLQNIDALQLLIARHADMSRRDKDGVTPLGMARDHWNWEFVALLEANGATDPGQRTGTRWDTPPTLERLAR